MSSCLIFVPALESKLVSQFCEDENGALIYNRIANGYNGYGNNGFRNGINGNYAIGGYGYRPVTEQETLNGRQKGGAPTGGGSSSSSSSTYNVGVQVEKTQHGSKGSSTVQVQLS